MYIDGSLIGGSPIVVIGDNNKLTTIDIGQSGSVTSLADPAIAIYSGPYSITNSGALSATNTDPSGGSFTPDGIQIYQDDAVSSGGTITNYGAIVGQRYGVLNVTTSGAGYLYNHGSITGGSDALYDDYDHVAFVYNYGSLDGGVFASKQTVEHLANSGDISGLVELDAVDSTLNNSGVINGDVKLAPGGAFHNSGIINGTLTLALNNEIGSTAFFNSGSIDDDVTFANTVDFTNTGAVNANIVFGNNSAPSGAFNIFNGVGGEVTGTVEGYGAKSQYYAGKGRELFDFTQDGAALVVAGTGSDTFEFTVGGLTSATKIKGSARDLDDTLEFTGPGTLTAGDFAHVTGIQKIVLASKDTLTLSAALVGSAYDATLAVDASAGSDRVNASALSAPDHALIYGGADDMIVAGGADTFEFDAPAASGSASYDTISNLSFALDSFVLSGGPDAVHKIDAAVTKGSLSIQTFNADLTRDLTMTSLLAYSAVLFTASAGGFKGDTFLIVNNTGSAGYSAANDYVFLLEGSVEGPLTTSNFK
jgi:hypothetical protein